MKTGRRDINEFQICKGHTVTGKKQRLLLLNVKTESTNKELQLNIKKITVMTTEIFQNLKVNDEKTEIITKFLFPSSIINQKPATKKSKGDLKA